MASQTLVCQSNGGHKSLGWARMVTKFGPGHTVKLYEDYSGYGRFPHGFPENIREGFIFEKQNTPPDMLQYISKLHFTIWRQTRNGQLNWSPAVLRSHSKNGVFVNRVSVPSGSSRILNSGDYIMVLNKTLFQFLDDREFDIADIPSSITDLFHIDGCFGTGAQSTVKLIHHRESQTKYAMKVISTKQFEAETQYSYTKRVQHMQAEVKTMQQLRHENIIKFIDAIEANSHLYIIMEYGEGGDLLQYSMSFPGYALPEPEAKFCFYQICEGLSYMHSKNIAHRDLKLENIFIANFAGEKLMKIGDFGFSKNADDHLLTQLGTKVFFPPEVQDRKGEYTLKADIWTLGCLFYAAFTGKYPFHTSYGDSLSQQIRYGDVDFNRPQFYGVSIHLLSLYCYLQPVFKKI